MNNNLTKDDTNKVKRKMEVWYNSIRIKSHKGWYKNKDDLTLKWRPASPLLHTFVHFYSNIVLSYLHFSVLCLYHPLWDFYSNIIVSYLHFFSICLYHLLWDFCHIRFLKTDVTSTSRVSISISSSSSDNFHFRWL